MKTTILKGQTYPDIIQLTIYPLPELTFTDPETGTIARYTVAITNNNVLVTVHTNVEMSGPTSQIYAQAYRLVRNAVDLYCFQTGRVIHVDLQCFVNPKGENVYMMFEHKSLASRCKAFDPVFMRNLYLMAATEQETFFALYDLVVAISIPEQAASNCAKVLETIRNVLAPDENEKTGWKVLQETLNADGQYLKYITETSKRPRHGHRAYIPPSILMKSLQRTWTIMDRLLEYKKRSAGPLPVSEFSLLCDEE